MELIYIIIVTILVVIIGYMISKILNSNGYLDSNKIETYHQLLLLSRVTIRKTVKDDKEKNKLLMIIDNVEDVLDYLIQSNNQDDNSSKKDLAIEQIKKSLKVMDIEVDFDNEIFIEILVDSCLRLLSKVK